MPDDSQTLTTIRSQTLALLAQITAQPKPSYSIDGQQVSWESYLRQLQEVVDWCDARLRDCEPHEETTQGVCP